MIIEKWKVFSREIALKAHVFRYVKVKSQSPNNGVIGDFDVIQCLNWINVIALTKDKKVIMVRQYRHGIEDVTYELPGGAVEPTENFLEAAKRELLEETGYQASTWKKLGRVSANPAFMNNYCETYLALDAELCSSQKLDAFEEIEVVSFDLEEIKKMIKNESIHHSLVVAAFYLLLTEGEGWA